MLKASKLRLGNLILSPFGRHETVFEIADNTDRGKHNQKGYENIILVEECGNQYKPIEIEGILLTREMFFNFGAEIMPLEKNEGHYNGNSDKNFGYPVIWLNKYEALTLNASEPVGYLFFNGYRIKCKYVHELQNLFFALTGKELTLKQNATHEGK